MKITALDRALLSIAPKYAIERIKARETADRLVRHYEAAQPSRRTQNWTLNAQDADAALRGAARELRWLARDLIRNNGFARRAQRVVANNTVGFGIIPKAVGPANTAADALWKRWAGTTDCESEGRHTFYGLQHLAMKALFSDGEVLFRRRVRRAKDKLTIPLQIQVLEADFLDTSKNTFGSDGEGPTIQGVVFDRIGRRVGYWLWASHPGSGRNVQASTLVPADEICHVYYTERPGQSRGVSWLAAAIVNLKDLDEYEDAELLRQKIAACFAAFVADTEGVGTAVGEQDTTNALIETLEPGMIAQLPPGKTITFGTPPVPAGDGLTTRNLRRVASGLGITFEDMTGDYSNVNFSSARMARISHWGNVNDWQTNMLIPNLCDGVWDWFVTAAQVAGELPEGEITAEWTCSPLPMLEPDKEALAIQRLMRVGALTPNEMVRQQGYNPDAHWAAMAEELAALDAKGIVLDSDPRHMTQAGQAQVDPDAAAEGTEDPASDAGDPTDGK